MLPGPAHSFSRAPDAQSLLTHRVGVREKSVSDYPTSNVPLWICWYFTSANFGGIEKHHFTLPTRGVFVVDILFVNFRTSTIPGLDFVVRLEIY